MSLTLITVAGISDLIATSGNSTTAVLVSDKNRGGVFNFASTGTADGGVTFAITAVGGGYWVRQLAENKGYNVQWFGAVGDGATNDTTAVQNAISTGKNVDFVGGFYLVNNLTQSTNSQVLYSSVGNAILMKNANGTIISSTGNSCEFTNLQFYGDSATPTYTGDNVSCTGNNVSFLNCCSQWAYGCALVATGNSVRIWGSNTIWQTTDTSGTGYDIKIGTSGTATLYHQLIGIVSGQTTGGINLIDTGSHIIQGGQFGKLYIAAGGSSSGSNGGVTMGARILGNVTVELSNAVLVGNAFGAVTITFASGTANCTLNESNLFESGASLVNSGNGNNLMVKNVSASSFPTLQYGQDSSNSQISYNVDGAGKVGFSGNVLLPNNKAIRQTNAAGTGDFNVIGYNSSDDLQIGYTSGSAHLYASSGIFFVVNNTSRWEVTSTDLRPVADNSYSLGTASLRPSVIYAATGSINTSDERTKQEIKQIDAPVLRAWGKVNFSQYKFRDAVEKKDDKARWHFGVIAQQVKEAFESENLDAFAYGILCFDEWEGGTQYGIRYDEALALECAYLRSKISN